MVAHECVKIQCKAVLWQAEARFARDCEPIRYYIKYWCIRRQRNICKRPYKWNYIKLSSYQITNNAKPHEESFISTVLRQAEADEKGHTHILQFLSYCIQNE